MKYKVNDAGDACCIQIGDVFDNELLLDFGFSNNDKFNRFLGQLCIFEENLGTKLLVSHYHTDHFNGLIKFAKCGKEIEMNEVYLPFIPQFDDSPAHYLLSKQIAFSFYLQSGYPLFKGSPSLYIEELIKRINNKPVVTKMVHQGSRIEIKGAVFDVIWPPAKIKNTADITTLKKQIKKIDTIIENSPYLKKIWSKFERNRESDCINDIDPEIIFEPNTETKNFLKIIQSVTNRFSICLFQPSCFLFLGDLEKQEIDAAIDYLKEKYRLNSIYILVPPHHGTHWSGRLNDVYAENLIVSSGKSRNKSFCENYKYISKKCFSTFFNGTIIAGTNQDNCLLNSLPCYKETRGIYFV